MYLKSHHVVTVSTPN